MKRDNPFFFFVAILLIPAAFSINLRAEEIAPKFIAPRVIQDPDAVSYAKEQQKISLSLRNIDILEALKFFSIRSGFNIVPTQKVGGRVTLNVENVAVKDVFDIMLRSNSLAYDKRGDIYNVMTEAEYKALFGKNFFDTRQVKLFHLKYAIPDQAFGILEALKSDIGRLLVDSESGAVMLIDTPERIADAAKAISELEQKSSIKVFTLKYAKAKEVEEQLKAQLDLKKVGQVKSDERTNQVVVQTLPERMKNIEELVASLDKKTKAVLIDVKIIKIQLTDQKDTGIQWEGLFNVAKQYGMAYIGTYPFSNMTAGVASPTFTSRSALVAQNNGVGQYPFSGTTSSLNSSAKTVIGQNMHVGIVDRKRDFDVLLNYLQTLGKSKIISSPSLSVVNNQEAKIHIGERRAYVTTTTTTGTTTSTVSEEVTYVDVGVRLSVIPMINDDGYVIMKVKPEISSVIDEITSSSNNKIPIIDTNMAETTVMAKDGATIIIGGLGGEEKTEDKTQTPFLGSIPLLGNLFKNSTARTIRTELIIMLTPIIFEGDKFVTAKDADKLPVKGAKKFDVFKPELPAPQALPQVPEVFIPIREDFMSKGFKSYDKNGLTANIQSDENQAKILMPLNGGVTTKGFKAYN